MGSDQTLDIEELTRLAKHVESATPTHGDYNWYKVKHLRKALLIARGDDFRSGPEEADAAFIAAANPATVLALLQELTELRAMKLEVHELAECALGRNPLPSALDFDLHKIEEITR